MISDNNHNHHVYISIFYDNFANLAFLKDHCEQLSKSPNLNEFEGIWA